MDEEPIYQRVRRMARNIGADGALGTRILDFLATEKIRRLMVSTAKQGVPPAAAVSDQLLEMFGNEALEPGGTRRFIGWAIRAIMQEEGFAPDQAGIRLPRDRLFGAASTYKTVPKGVSSEIDSFLARLISPLSGEELRRLRFHIDARLKDDGA